MLLHWMKRGLAVFFFEYRFWGFDCKKFTSDRNKLTGIGPFEYVPNILRV